MRKFSILLVATFMLLFSIPAQCDLVLTDVDLDAGTFTIDFVNTTNCGGTGGPDGVSEIQIGFHALDPDNGCSSMNQGWMFPSGYGILGSNNHPGWIFSATSAELPQSNWTNLYPDWSWDIDPPYYAGETITFPLYNQYQSDCIDGPYANSSLCQLEGALNYWIDEGYSIEAVIWQISYGPTMYADEGGWAEVGPLGDGTTPDCCGIYDDDNFEDNVFIIGPCAQPTPGPDAVIDDITFEIGCIGDVPAYQLTYTVWNYGDEEITDYCVEIWNEDYYQCFDSELFGNYGIPAGQGQQFTTPFFEYNGFGSFFTMSVDSVDGEIITGNNNTTVYYPDTLENLVCPVVLDSDTIFVYETDTLYIELPPDTIVELQIDTVFTQEYVYITDTLIEYITDTVFVDNYIYTIDTLYLDNFIYDTTFVEVIDYVFLTDTIIEYIEIDCETGLPCDNFDINGCEGNIFIPNVFTPNNDGFNDVWKPIYDLECWVNVEFKIYNRWGSLVYEGWGDDFWDGSNKGGPSYVADGIYVYTFRAREYNSPEIYEKNGHLTILR